MNSFLYLGLNLISISLPFFFSFHPRIAFHRVFSALFFALACGIMVYIPWDIQFTELGVWGFNETYLTGFKLGGLPIEEWLFFVCIPFACLFTFHVLEITWLKNWVLKPVTIVYYIICILLVLVGARFGGHLYSVTTFLLAAVITLLANFFLSKKELSVFLVGYSFILVPFLLINGTLTGTFLESPVVWYNDLENLGIRVGTIPLDDFSYAWGLLLLNFGVFKFIQKPHSP